LARGEPDGGEVSSDGWPTGPAPNSFYSKPAIRKRHELHGVVINQAKTAVFLAVSGLFTLAYHSDK
jgi:hypothetical protein